MEFTKETDEVVSTERENVVKEIDNLVPTKCEISSEEASYVVNVEHKLGKPKKIAFSP